MRGSRINKKWETSNYWNATMVMEVLHFPKVRLGQIESLVVLVAILLIFLGIFGAHRRNSSNKMFQVILWTAYIIPPSLINYTLGLMHATPFKNDLFLIWATFLMMLLGSADFINAYHLEDNEQWKRHSWKLLIKMMVLGLLLSMYVDASTLLTALQVLYCVALVKITERVWASRLASKAVLQRNNKWIVDHMRREHPKSIQDGEVDLTTMKGYNYIVDRIQKWGDFFFFYWLIERLKVFFFFFWPPKWGTCITLLKGWFRRMQVEKAQAPDYLVPFDHLDHQVITVEKVWQCEGKLLREGDLDHRLKDHCLSFALFKILSSRYAGYSMPQEVFHKSWKLFQKIIKSPNEKGVERAFRIIEVELGLIFYQLYTKCQVFFQFGVLKYIQLMLMITGSCIVASIIMHQPKSEGYVQLTTLNGLSIDVLLTSMIIITVLSLEIALHVYFSCFTEWGKVAWICSYVHRESQKKKPMENEPWWNKLMKKLIEFLCRLPTRKPWERKLRQYSLLESYSYHPPFLLYNPITTLFIDQKREGRKESKSTELLTEVKSAVINSIVDSDGSKLKNGKVSLSGNEMPMLLWARKFETQAQVIMIWHIATSMCEYKIPVKSSTASLKHFTIATNLSKYLAYLVAFAPRLLPDHPYVTEYVLDQVIIEAQETFSTCNNLEDRIRELEHIRSQQQSETVMDKGARLGMQLLHDVKNPDIIWKVLSDFWAELIAYVAPSNEVTAHMEHLTKGGEFVSHIWALLTHSGIKRKPSRE